MSDAYYAITRRQAQWVFVCAGQDPTQVYQDAFDILQRRPLLDDEHLLPISPHAEHQLSSLRVVPAAVARDTYRVLFRRIEHDEDW